MTVICVKNNPQGWVSNRNPTPVPMSPKNAFLIWQTALPGASNYEPFVRAGHSLSTLLAGLLGALIARRMHATGEPQMNVA
jgi:hypothetical protein